MSVAPSSSENFVEQWNKLKKAFQESDSPIKIDLPEYTQTKICVSKVSVSGQGPWETIKKFFPQGGWVTTPSENVIYYPELSGDNIEDQKNKVCNGNNPPLAGEWYGNKESLQLRFYNRQWIITSIVELVQNSKTNELKNKTEVDEANFQTCFYDEIAHLLKGNQGKLHYRRYWQMQQGKLAPFASRLIKIENQVPQ